MATSTDEDPFDNDDTTTTNTLALCDHDRILIADPLAMETAVSIIEVSEHMVGEKASGPTLGEFEGELGPITVVLLLAGHIIHGAGDGFSACGWPTKLRNAVKAVKGFRKNNAALVEAATWLLEEGLASVLPDPDGFSAIDNINTAQRVKILQGFLVNEYANLFATPAQADEMLEHAKLLTKIAGVDLRVKPNRGFDIAAELDADPDPQYKAPVIHGIARRGEVTNINADPKVGKSWLLASLALAAAAGTSWLGRHVERCNVLYLDAELHPQTLKVRLKIIMEAMHITKEDIRGRNRFEALRGTQPDRAAILQAVAAGEYQLVIIDPFYRFLGNGESENDDAAVRQFYDDLIKLATETDSCVVMVHHFTKGDNTKKSITSRGSGSGVMSRAADNHLTILYDEDVEQFYYEGVTRTFPLPEKTYLRHISDTVRVLVPDVEHVAEGGHAEGKAIMAAQQFAERFTRPDPESRDVIFDRAASAVAPGGKKLPVRKIRALFDRAVDDGHIKLVVGSDGRSKRYRRDPTQEETVLAAGTQALKDAHTTPPAGPSPKNVTKQNATKMPGARRAQHSTKTRNRRGHKSR
jgi:hypothetical protein